MVAPSPEPAKKPEPERRILSLPKRFRRNVSTGYLKTGSSALITLVMTPVLITGLGTEAFGIWIVIGSLALYREILQFGFSTATPKYVAEYSALDDQERLRSSIATAFWMLAIPGALALVLGLGLAAVFPELFHVSSGLQGQTQLLVLIIAIDFAVAIPTDAFGGVLVGLQRYDLLNTTLITVNVGQAIAWAVVIVAGGGLVPLGASTVAISLLGQLWRYRIARRLVPGFSISPRSIDRKLVRPFTGLSVWYAVQNVATLVLNRIDTIVVGIVLGVAAAGVYAVGQKFTLAIGQLLTPVSTVFFPHSSELSAQRDTAGLRRSLLTGTRILLAVAAPFALTLAILAGPLIQAWVGSGFQGAVPVVIFLAGAVSIWAVSETGLVMLEGDGRIRVPALIRASEAVLNFALSLTLAHLIGLKGVALGTLLAAAAANLLVFIPHMCRQFGLELRVFAGSLVVAHAPPAATALAVGWLVTRADPSTVPALAAAALAIVGAYLAVFAITGFNGRERRMLIARLRGLRSRPYVSRA
jgi:O-antigen/teichoic acid export membrane protein